MPARGPIRRRGWQGSKIENRATRPCWLPQVASPNQTNAGLRVSTKGNGNRAPRSKAPTAALVSVILLRAYAENLRQGSTVELAPQVLTQKPEKGTGPPLYARYTLFKIEENNR